MPTRRWVEGRKANGERSVREAALPGLVTLLAILTVLVYQSTCFFNMEDWRVKNPTWYPWVEVWNSFAVAWLLPLLSVVSGASLFFAVARFESLESGFRAVCGVVEGLAVLAQDACFDAITLFQESVAVFEEIRQKENQGWALGPLGLAARGAGKMAVEAYACASRYGFVANSRWFEDVVGQQIRTMAASLPAQSVESAQERGRTQDWDVMASELLSQL